MSNKTSGAVHKELFGHPVGLFILFFTEMWERFSYYGMRALLVLYLISELSGDNPGLGWSKAEASELYGWYTMLVYITPIIGGILADKIYGFRKAILIGGVLMTLGHLSLAGNLADNQDLVDSVNASKNAPLTKVEKDRLVIVGVLAFFSIFFWAAFEQAGSSMSIFASENTDRSLAGSGIAIFKIVSAILSSLPVIILTWIWLGVMKTLGKEYSKPMFFMGLSVVILWGMIVYMVYQQFFVENPEVPATWFQSLNALFIFTLAPLFSWIWEKLSGTRLNPNGMQKFAIGLFLLGIGFIPMVIGASQLGGDATFKVSMIFLVLAYLLHTMGELSLSPVGLSYVNKLSPKKLLGVMFGIWFFASAMGNKLAGSFSSYMEHIAETQSMAYFFQILVWIPIIGGLVLFALSFPLKKLMHGIE